jgi:hypothetical protein
MSSNTADKEGGGRIQNTLVSYFLDKPREFIDLQME